MFSLFQRAASYAPLQPLERAALKLIETCVLAGAVAALPVLAQLFAHQQIDWANVLRTAAATFAMAALVAGLKYLKAQNDPAINDLVSGVEQSVLKEAPGSAL